jgi:hypothetical protein
MLIRCVSEGRSPFQKQDLPTPSDATVSPKVLERSERFTTGKSHTIQLEDNHLYVHENPRGQSKYGLPKWGHHARLGAVRWKRGLRLYHPKAGELMLLFILAPPDHL